MTDDPPTSGSAAPHQPSETFAAKLSRLIATIHPPDRKPYSYRELAAGIADTSNVKVSAGYLNQLATGQRGSPGFDLVSAIAAFFGVPVTYFADDEVTRRIDQQLADLQRYRDSDAQAIAERIMGLDERGRGAVDALVDSLEQYEAQPRSTRRRRKPSSPEA
ncbi:transcriptional regulator [Amycolatopsis sp. A1MSW2902]|uniref:helix-turn-helix transcriptional regulator n=1 Tax=Amycolatopsis sp. A1MSW2902 TaxID=687413 RepID=UPI00307E8532